MGAGHFIDHLEWLQRGRGAGDGFGQKADTFASQGYLWCAVEDLDGGRASAKESEHQERTATVRIRQRPGVAAGDRLRDPIRGDVWTVTATTFDRRANELVCDVTSPKWTAGGGTA